ncbi:type III pantothenate kinase [bacterium]|nr:type III pantothenate kinase [bacterium]
MATIITFDIGNTNTLAGIWQEDVLADTFRISTDISKTSDEYGVLFSEILRNKNISNIQGGIISSVVPQLVEVIKEAAFKYLNVELINLTHKSKMPVKLALDNNSEIGADRIANASAAMIKYKLPVIVIDFGTATTFDIVNSKGCFIGGLIAPGLSIQASALSKFTSKLPKLKIEAPKTAIGSNTISAMLSGIVTGHACMISGMIKKCEEELKETATIVLTGGYSPVLYDCTNYSTIDKNLTLFGLKELYYLNME